MSNAIRKYSRGLLLPLNGKQRKILYRLRQSTKKIVDVINSLQDKSNAISQVATS